jgi:hypothetical protein
MSRALDRRLSGCSSRPLRYARPVLAGTELVRAGWSRVWSLRRQPLRFGVLYLSLVPVFAVAFASLGPSSLHDANSGLESTSVTDARSLAATLTREMRSRSSRVVYRTGAGLRQTVPDTIAVAKIQRSREGSVQIELTGDTEELGERQPNSESFSERYGNFSEILTVFPEGKTVTPFANGVRETLYSVELVNNAGIPAEVPAFVPPVSELLPVPNGFFIGPNKSSQGYLRMSVRTGSRFEGFLKTQEGDPYYASGRYWRMLYLSATTITTLGVGDVSPVSGLARFLVGFEAVLGLVLIGLLLNDLAKFARGSNSGPDSKR